MNRYRDDVYSISLIALFTAITILLAFFTSHYFPFPKIAGGGRPDIWWGIPIVGMIFLKEWKYRLLFVGVLMIAMMSTEMSHGFLTYFMTVSIPLMVYSLIVFMPKKIWQIIVYSIALLVLMSFVRLMMAGISLNMYGLRDGSHIGFGPSLLLPFIGPNIGIDLAVCIPFTLVPLIKLIKIHK